MFFQETENAIFHQIEAGFTHDGDRQDGTDFRNPDSQRTRDYGFPMRGKSGSRHQGYEKRAAPADDEYDYADAKTPIGVHRIIRHLDILPSVFYFL
jgi:hypothetical protein